MISGVNHVTLVVADLSRAIGFYQCKLGLTLRALGSNSAYLEGGSLWLCLELGTPDRRDDDSHIALSCRPEDYQTLCVRLHDAPRWKSNSSEGASLYVRDTDGHKLELHLGNLESRLTYYRATPSGGMTVL